jgi:hypothetical protein
VLPAVGIEYQTIVPGQRHFECARLRALLSTASCADRWAKASLPDMEKLITCKRCPVGWKHHEEHHHPEDLPAAAAKEQQRSAVCLRCGRTSWRLVGNVICLSCYNRNREWLRGGLNARGNPLVDYKPVVPRRVGVVGNDGAPSWRLFDGQHLPESTARACRSGLRLSAEQPGRTHWNESRGQFEYRDEQGRVLLELEIDGRIEFVGVERLHQGERPAAVRMPTILMSAREAETWLTVSGEGDHLTADPRQTEFACSSCRQGMLHAHKRAGQVVVECSAGCS